MQNGLPPSSANHIPYTIHYLRPVKKLFILLRVFRGAITQCRGVYRMVPMQAGSSHVRAATSANKRITNNRAFAPHPYKSAAKRLFFFVLQQTINHTQYTTHQHGSVFCICLHPSCLSRQKTLFLLQSTTHHTP